MKKVLVLYFSGAGSTKHAAQVMCAYLSQYCKADMHSTEENTAFAPNDYDAFVIGTPVYHAAPALGISAYFRGMDPLKKGMPAFLYNTRALWSCNTNRILAKQVREKNIIPVMDRAYRSPASDGALIAPFVKRFFAFEKDLKKKIERDCRAFLQLLEKGAWEERMPRFHLSSILNAPNKLAGQLTTFQIYLHREKCGGCGSCITGCPQHAIRMDPSGYPVFLSKNCENCYRCIHHCPHHALSLSRRKPPEKLLGSPVSKE